MPDHVALLYSIVLGPGRRVVMADLRALAADLGLAAPRTIGATGNLVFAVDDGPLGPLEARIEAGFAARFGKPIGIILRAGTDWRRLAASNPFPAEAAAAGNRVHVRVMRAPLDPAEFRRLQSYADGGEQLRLVDGDLWIHFAEKLPSEGRLLGQLTWQRGGAGTVRNWNTVAKIAALLEQS